MKTDNDSDSDNDCDRVMPWREHVVTLDDNYVALSTTVSSTTSKTKPKTAPITIFFCAQHQLDKTTLRTMDKE